MQMKREQLAKEVVSLLERISREMLSRAQADLDKNIVDADLLDNLPEKMIRLGWCGSEECGREIEVKTGRSILGSNMKGQEARVTKCVVCRKESNTVIYIARPL
jgi:prolyl-tRNA synthetase